MHKKLAVRYYIKIYHFALKINAVTYYRRLFGLHLGLEEGAGLLYSNYITINSYRRHLNET